MEKVGTEGLKSLEAPSSVPETQRVEGSGNERSKALPDAVPEGEGLSSQQASSDAPAPASTVGECSCCAVFPVLSMCNVFAVLFLIIFPFLLPLSHSLPLSVCPSSLFFLF